VSNENKFQGQKFLVIRAYPAGMGSCLRHVINGLIYAELTQRIPVVFWKQESLYYEANENLHELENNAFEYYFQPISSYSLDDIVDKNYTYFPPHWNDFNIGHTHEPSFFSPPFALPCTLTFSGSNADVLVSAYWQETGLIQQIIPEDNHLKRLSYGEIYNYYFKKYIRLKEHIIGQIGSFYAKYMCGYNMLGVHVRRTDKVDEIVLPNLSRYIKAINTYIKSVNNAQIFLATDSNDVIEKFRKIYDNKIVFTDCIRSDDSSPIHLTSGSKRLKGEQILIDMYLLGKCNFYIGLYFSNITPVVIWMLKDPNASKNESTFISEGIPERFKKFISDSDKKYKYGIKKALNKIKRFRGH
jgi:Alpha-(1,6)-fucosyltransferase N- and catalytic domains